MNALPNTDQPWPSAGEGLHDGRPVLDLPRLVLRRAALVALLALAAAAWLGWRGAAQDIMDETAAAQGLATALEVLNSPAPVDASQAARLQAGLGLRHLQLSVFDAQGRMLFSPTELAPPSLPMQWLLALHRRWQALPEEQIRQWQVPRPEGAWTVRAHVSPESERREALADLCNLLGVLAAGLLALWLGLSLSTRRAFEPLAQLVRAIGDVAPRGAKALHDLPAMPIRELAAITHALQHLASDLDQAQAQQRLLSQKVQSVQEDERNRLARELHDEMGQRLTALRVDMAWLARQLKEQPALQAVVQAMSQRCEEAQMDLRQVLLSLSPLGGTSDAGERVALERVLHLISDLVASWCAGAAAQAHQAPQPVFEVRQGDVTTSPGCAEMTHCEPLSPVLAQGLSLAPALALALYRLSQEGLTNVARHAHARRVTLSVTVLLRGDEGHEVIWSLVDDGVGLPHPADVLHRGNGLGGMQERVWALGGEWRCEPAGPSPRPGLRLTARLPWSGVAS